MVGQNKKQDIKETIFYCRNSTSAKSKERKRLERWLEEVHREIDPKKDVRGNIANDGNQTKTVKVNRK